MSEIKTAVITGQHAFDVPGFHALFRSIPEIDFYLQDLENSESPHGYCAGYSVAGGEDLGAECGR